MQRDRCRTIVRDFGVMGRWDNMCTGIKINYNDGCVMGRTMDYEIPLSYNAIYLPKNYNFCNDLMGNPLYSKYKTLGMCFRNHDPLKDGVNEHGLIGITNDFSGDRKSVV